MAVADRESGAAVKVLCIIGTRPEAVKLAPVVLRLQEVHAAGNGARVKVCATGQHREMLDQVLSLFRIRPYLDLHLMSPDQTVADLTGRAVTALHRAVRDARPDAVLVQGDTTTAMTGALAAFYCKVPVGHVEAGLRTGDRYSPFPEEVNRRIISTLATWHFAPTRRAADALRSEGIAPSSVFVTGNTAIDALLWVLSRLPRRRRSFKQNGGRLLLVTAHRRENLGPALERICLAIKEICRRNPDVSVLYPVHLNPNVRRPVTARLGGLDRVTLCEPLGYRDFVGAMQEAHLILTDSGGVQEEAPSMGRPVLVLRDETERPEAVEAGAAKLVGTEVDRIVDETQKLLDDAEEYRRMATRVNPFGDGHAAERIVKILVHELSVDRTVRVGFS